ncbi:hypothetical protein LAZ67_20001885 [Cordylochernes scorpioides]|uniref:Reverse transcriptase Ty1/copia-type domain-containing protein n=1 Tax=Cordylochernes scorpioides TaxID=51811 RepID=A0ABY6LKB6_9ARAC|nr:hypothetical protein LAZ67_20001885 [Cordylochernes scorpioides]
MELPESSLNHENSSNEVCLLKKSIYGLKQSGHEWNEKLDQILTSIGLERSRMDPCVYFSKDIILGVYVDDLLVTTSSVEAYVKFKSSIQREVDIKDLGEVSDLLSVRIKRNKESNLELDQTHYIEEILKEYGMEHAKEASTPLDPGMFTEGPEGKEACRAPYQQAIGNLLWLAGMTRPDIAYAVSYLSKFNSSPLQQHWNAVKHLLRYLKKTKDLKLVFSKTGKKLAAFADADWGSDKEDRKSYSGYIFVLGGAAISWCSRKQKCVALSTAEAEYYAMCEAAKEALWFTSFMEEIGVGDFKESPLKIYIDNQGAMFLAENEVVSERSKHIDIRHFFIRDLIKDGNLSFVYVPTEENPADLFTKNLKAPALQQNYTKLGLFILVRDFLRDRRISLSFGERKLERNCARGCPQGSCCGPILWNILVNTVFQEELPEGARLVLYADEQFLTIEAASRAKAEKCVGTSLQILSIWALSSMSPKLKPSALSLGT